MSDNLSAWLATEINSRRLSIRELARMAGISHTTINDVLNNQRAPTWEFCYAIARTLELDPLSLFRRAGLLPTLPAEIEEAREADHIIRNLAPELRAVAMIILRSLKSGSSYSKAPAMVRALTEQDHTYTQNPNNASGPLQLSDLEADVNDLITEFPLLAPIFEDATAQNLSPEAIHALILNARIFLEQYQSGDMSFAAVHGRLSDLFKRLSA